MKKLLISTSILSAMVIAPLVHASDEVVATFEGEVEIVSEHSAPVTAEVILDNYPILPELDVDTDWIEPDFSDPINGEWIPALAEDPEDTVTAEVIIDNYPILPDLDIKGEWIPELDPTKDVVENTNAEGKVPGKISLKEGVLSKLKGDTVVKEWVDFGSADKEVAKDDEAKVTSEDKKEEKPATIKATDTKEGDKTLPQTSAVSK